MLRAAQRLIVELCGGRQTRLRGQAVEPIEERERGGLVLDGELVLVVALGHRDAVAMAEAAVDAGDLAERPARALDREEVEHRGRHEHGPRVHQQQQARVIDAVRDHAGRDPARGRCRDP